MELGEGKVRADDAEQMADHHWWLMKISASYFLPVLKTCMLQLYQLLRVTSEEYPAH